MIEPLTLHIEAFWESPWDCTAFVALREKGLPFATSIAIVREGAGLLDPLREKSLTGRAPALQHGDFWVAESLAIVEYLEEAFPPPVWPRLWPAQLRARARARHVTTWLRTSLGPLQEERPSQLIFYPAKPPSLRPPGQRAAEELVRVATMLGVRPGSCLFDEFSIVDLDLSFALMRLLRSGHELPATVADYAEGIWARPSVREFALHARPPNPPFGSGRF